MSENKKKNTSLMLLCAAFLLAVVLVVVAMVQRNNLSTQVSDLTASLADSQANWQTTAAEKEELQATLATT